MPFSFTRNSARWSLPRQNGRLAAPRLAALSPQAIETVDYLANLFIKLQRRVDVTAITGGKPDPLKSFHVEPLAERAAKRPVTMGEKAVSFENEAKHALQKLAIQQKQDAPAWYKAWLRRPAALQVVFFGMDPNKVPAYALVSFGVQENASGDPNVTVARTFCPGKDCNEKRDLLILGEQAKADELSNQPSFFESDLADAARSLIEVETHDKPNLVKPPIDVLRVSLLGANWIWMKPQCRPRKDISKPASRQKSHSR